MTIPASELVDLQPRTLGGGLNGVELNGVLLSNSDLLPANMIYPFGSPDAVSNYFGAESEEYALASGYFLADDNKQKSPTTLYFYRIITDAAAGWLRGARVSAKVDAFQAVTDGALSLSIDGKAVNLTGIDLSEATSYSAVAAAVQTKLQTVAENATVVYNSNFGAFIITSGTTGENSSVSFASSVESGTDLSALMNLSQSSGAVTSIGSAAQTLTETMQNLIKSGQNWVTFMPVFQETDEQKEELAAWCNSKGTRFAYIANEVNGNALIPNNVACFAQQVKDYNGIFNGYNTKAFCALAMGYAASMDLDRTNGRKAFAYRSQAGLTFTVDDAENAAALLGNGYNFYGSYATAAEEFTLAQNGQISGNAKWFDTYLGQIWLKARMQAAWLTVLKNANTLPFNSDGYSAIYAGSIDVINAGINAGLIVSGVNLSAAQLDQVNREAGLDISESLYTQGWYLQIPDANTNTRVARGPLRPNFWYCDGGSIQSIQGISTTIL